MMASPLDWIMALGYALDIATLAMPAAAAWFWHLASSDKLHRVSIDEQFDYHDLNRVIVAINRNNIRNRRAALASALAVLLLSVDLLLTRWLG
jgi:hypothetical protein